MTPIRDYAPEDDASTAPPGGLTIATVFFAGAIMGIILGLAL